MAQVLIADSDQAHTDLVEILLSLDHHEVHTLREGRAALEFLRNHTPDLIILDIQLPDISGIEVCARVKKVSRLRNVPVMILTGVRDRTLLEQALLASADDVVPKPLEGKDFRAMVANLLSPRAA